ncbi:MAG: hypothetical protein IKB86_07615 [Clostridia bacterium]|nr:hypothetical protein [Clostridia bacterium]
MDLSLTKSSPLFQGEKNAILGNKSTHAYIIEGAQGIGKTSFALAASCVHFCTSENKPCFECASCRKVLEGNHPDVHVIYPENNMLRVNQVRDALSTIHETPYEGKSKIYIFKDFHLANEHSQNALLKTLEEPPKSVSFFLLTENSLAALPTVRSRCKKLRLTGFSQEEILQFLEKSFPNNDRNRFAAQNSFGNVGDAIKLVNDEEYIRLFDKANNILRLSESGDFYADIALELEKEKNILALLHVLENLFFAHFKQNPELLVKLGAIQNALTQKKKNVNGGLVTERLAYILAKGGTKWQK